MVCQSSKPRNSSWVSVSFFPSYSNPTGTRLILIVGAIESDVYIPSASGSEWYIEVCHPLRFNGTGTKPNK
jgi:hypothetical protein